MYLPRDYTKLPVKEEQSWLLESFVPLYFCSMALVRKTLCTHAVILTKIIFSFVCISIQQLSSAKNLYK